MKKVVVLFFSVFIVSLAFATELKNAIKVEVPEEITSGSPIVIKLGNIPKGYSFHGYFFHAAHPNVPAGLDKGVDVFTRKNKNPKWIYYIFGTTMADRLTYIQAKDMWKRDFVLSFKTNKWPIGDYQTNLNLSFLDAKRKQIIIKTQHLFSIVEKDVKK